MAATPSQDDEVFEVPRTPYREQVGGQVVVVEVHRRKKDKTRQKTRGEKENAKKEREREKEKQLVEEKNAGRGDNETKEKERKLQKKEGEEKEKKQSRGKEKNKRRKEGKEGKKKSRRIRIVHVSDTHDNHRLVKLPDMEADIFVHTGDFSHKRDWKAAGGEIPEIVKDFNAWLGELPYKHKIVIAGNNELGFNDLSKEESRNVLSNATYLQDEAVTIMGIRFYGSPWTTSRNMGFSAKSSKIVEKWAQIPPDTDVLLTHMPPRGIRDLTGTGRWGSPSLLERVLEIKPRMHLYGHVHEDVGPYLHKESEILFNNAAFDQWRNTYVFKYGK